MDNMTKDSAGLCTSSKRPIHHMRLAAGPSSAVVLSLLSGPAVEVALQGWDFLSAVGRSGNRTGAGVIGWREAPEEGRAVELIYPLLLLLLPPYCTKRKLRAGCSTMSSAQSGDISGYHLSGEWTAPRVTDSFQHSPLLISA
ncbi:synaptotagmin-12 [Lates japonicus]|uniref:Synaptotagmin-12 n=1 Tax=Lates japonicus TaxID=270547 RepID=A0AAD3RKC2_LATJO|nr:synaptotagmin-12 [Lates japonicus]